jgi:hypothetical protein
MRAPSIRPQNTTPLKKKVKWELYEEKHFKKLKKIVIDLVHEFVGVSLAAKKGHHRHCEALIPQTDDDSTPILQSIVVTQDEELKDAISEVSKSRVTERTWKCRWS